MTRSETNCYAYADGGENSKAENYVNYARAFCKTGALEHEGVKPSREQLFSFGLVNTSVSISPREPSLEKDSHV